MADVTSENWGQTKSRESDVVGFFLICALRVEGLDVGGMPDCMYLCGWEIPVFVYAMSAMGENVLCTQRICAQRFTIHISKFELIEELVGK